MNLMSKSLRISKKEVTAIISLFMGDLINPHIDKLIKTFCKRHKMPEYIVPVIKSLIALVTSEDS